MSPIAVSIFVCIASFFALLTILRRDRVSLGIPLAYLFELLLNHVPGAYAHEVGGTLLTESNLTEIGIRLTAVGSVSFVAAVWLHSVLTNERPMPQPAQRERFWLFCVFGGWLVTYGLSFLRDIPSFGAALERGGTVWMLGVMLGLRSAMQRQRPLHATVWLAALMVFPVLMLLLGGFLSYGTTAILIVLSVLAISTRSTFKTALGICAVALLGFTLFLSYFQSRLDIRDSVWGGAPISERMTASSSIFSKFEWFDSNNPAHLNALDARLNQNFFVGLAASRIENRQVESLSGRSLWEGLMSLVPRTVWPDKPVFGGSPKIVGEMTGLQLSTSSSFGVGQVMEFEINFGINGVVIGFFLLGWLMRALDRKAALAEANGDLGRMFLFFLPAAALVKPLGSLVELFGGAAAALVAAFAWQLAWERWSSRGSAEKLSRGSRSNAQERAEFVGPKPAAFTSSGVVFDLRRPR